MSKQTYIHQMEGPSDAIIANHAYLCSFRCTPHPCVLLLGPTRLNTLLCATVNLSFGSFGRSWVILWHFLRLFGIVGPRIFNPHYALFVVVSAPLVPTIFVTGLARQVGPCAQCSCGVHVHHKEK